MERLVQYEGNNVRDLADHGLLDQINISKDRDTLGFLWALQTIHDSRGPVMKKKLEELARKNNLTVPE